MPLKYQLKNGLKVLLVESHKSPVVSVQMWVRNGSADEKKGQEGISHFIEHLLFKGTKRFGVGEIAKAVEGSGGELNAYTSFDQTVYYVTISSQFADTALDVISEMMKYPTFDPKEVQLEKEVVIEEIKRSLDSPHRQASRLLFSTLYKSHPYGIPVIGYAENIRHMTTDEIREFFEERYTPSNMTLVVAGDFDATEMKRKISSLFATVPAARPSAIRRKKESNGKGRVQIQKSSFQETFLYLAWRSPNAFHRDIPALDILALILGQGDSSRLVRSIKYEKHLVNSVGASCYAPIDPGFFAISSSLNENNIGKYLDALGDELEKFLLEGPTPEEISKALLNIESDKFYSLETVDGLSNLFGHYEFTYGDYRMFNKFLKQMEVLTPKDILNAARKYLRAEGVYVSCLSPGHPEEIKKEVVKFQRRLKGILAKRPKVPKAPKLKRVKMKWAPPKGRHTDVFEKWTLSNGTRVLICDAKDTPVVNARAGFIGGLRFENPKHAGVSELLSRVWTAGSQKRSEDTINAELESMASHLSAFAGRNSVGMTFTALSPFAEKTFELWSELMVEPLFGEAPMEREKALMLETLRLRQDNPAQKCILNMSRELFGAHPYGRDPIGDSECIPSLTTRDVCAFYDKIVSSRNLVIAVYGDIKKGNWKQRLEEGLGKLQSHPIEAPPLERPYLPESRQVFEGMNKEQTHIALCVPGLTVTDPSRYTLDVLQAVLSGQGGRLFVELRDRLSLAYSVAPLRLDGLDGGYFGTYIGCSPEKAELAIKMMRQELNKLANDLIGPAELDSAKRYLIGRHDISNQRGSNVVTMVLYDELYDLPEDEYLRYSTYIQEVTADNVRELAQRLFGQNEVLSLVGPRSVSN